MGKKGRCAKIKISADGLIRSEVLGGFQFRISDLCRQPCLRELTEDMLYKHYVMTEYQAEPQRESRGSTERNRSGQLGLTI